MIYNDYYLSQLRLVILRILSEVPAYTCNNSALKEALKAWAFDVSLISFQSQLEWLRDAGLITIEDNEIKPSIKILKITQRGLEVSQGLSEAEGVAKPSP